MRWDTVFSFVFGAVISAGTVWFLADLGVPTPTAVIVGISLGVLWIVWRWMRGKL